MSADPNMEQELAHLGRILTKLDTSVEKLTAISADVTQLLAVHENRLSYQDRLFGALDTKIEKNDEARKEATDDIHARIDASEKDLLTKISEQTNKIGSLQQWMWTALGGGGVLLFILDKVLPSLIG